MCDSIADNGWMLKQVQHNKIILVVAGILSVMSFGVAQAQPAEIVISPTRQPTAIQEIGSSVTVIGEDELEKSQQPNLAEVLRRVPGLDVVRNGPTGQITRIFMRGTDSNHVLVLVDGVKVNDPSSTDNAFDFARLSTDNIERVEVLRGPQSTLYGSEAIGGVISVTTRRGSGPAHQTVTAEGGSFGTVNLAIGSSGGANGTDYSMNLAHHRTDGVTAASKRLGASERDGNDSTVFSTRLNRKVNDNWAVSATARLVDNRVEYDESFPVQDANYESKTQEYNARLAAEYTAENLPWRQEVALARSGITRKNIDAFSGRNVGTRTAVEWMHYINPAPAHRVTLGAEGERTEYEGRDTGSGSIVTADANIFSLLAQDQWKLAERLYVTAGGRIDRHDTFGTVSTYRIAPAYTLAGSMTTLRASYGTGFKAPALFELYDPFYGNRDVKPERSRGWDAGFEQPFYNGTLVVGATYFENAINNLIDADPTTFVAINTGRVRTRGVEANAAWHPTNALDVTGNYTFTDAQDLSADVPLIRRPKNKASLAVNVRPMLDVTLGVEGQYNGARQDSRFPGRVDLGGYTLLNLRGEWQMQPGVALTGRVENLLNRDYQEIYGYGTAGFAAYGGVRLEF